MASSAELLYDKYMHNFEHENLLHKIVAGSAFVFALCVLPLANYALQSGRNQAQEAGKVAGASTDTTIINGDIAKPQITPQATPLCGAEQAQALANLDLFVAGQKSFLQKQFSENTAQYTAAIAHLTGTKQHVASEKLALQSLIQAKQDDYSTRLAKVESVVAPQKAALLSASCPTE